MYPFVRDDDFVVVRKLPVERLRRGCLIVFADPEDRLIIHRMVGKKGSWLLLKGDGHDLQEERVAWSAVKGKAIGILRGDRFIRLSRFKEWISWMISFPRKYFIGIRKMLKPKICN